MAANKTKSAADRAELRANVIRLHHQKMRPLAIASEVGVTRSQVSRYLSAYAKELVAAGTRDLDKERERAIKEIETMEESHWQTSREVLDPKDKVRAVEAALKCRAEVSKLLGLYAPQKQQLELNAGAEFYESLLSVKKGFPRDSQT